VGVLEARLCDRLVADAAGELAPAVRPADGVVIAVRSR
jgi:hypothetical protein